MLLLRIYKEDPNLFKVVSLTLFLFAEICIYPSLTGKNDTVKITRTKSPAIDNYPPVLSVEKYPTPFTAY